MTKFTKGDVAKLKVVFGEYEEPVDPTTVTFRVREPTNRLVTEYVYGVHPQLVRQSVGVYYVNVFVDAVGTWEFGWQTTGPVGVREGEFLVVASRFA